MVSSVLLKWSHEQPPLDLKLVDINQENYMNVIIESGKRSGAIVYHHQKQQNAPSYPEEFQLKELVLSKS